MISRGRPLATTDADRLRTLTLALGLSCVLGACAAAAGSRDRDTAAVVCERWLQYVENDQHEAAWDEASRHLQEAISKKGWVDGAKEARARRGAVVSRELLRVRDLPQHKYSIGVVDTFIFVYRTQFKNIGPAREEVAVVRDPDAEWRVYLHLPGLRLE